jgi:hypothetical protein
MQPMPFELIGLSIMVGFTLGMIATIAVDQWAESSARRWAEQFRAPTPTEDPPMVSRYDVRMSDAKQAVTKALCGLAAGNPGLDVGGLATAIDNLNRAWDQLTDALVRQRDERDEQIGRLMNEVAERRHAVPRPASGPSGG